MKISAVLPVYNSGNILLDSYKEIKRQLEKITPDYEILFRNDASKDGSENVLQRIAAEDNKVRIFANIRNQGLGFTLRSLFKDAKGELVIYFDADSYLCFDLGVLPDFLKTIEKDADVVTASRYEKNDSHIPFYRMFSSGLYDLMSRILFNIRNEDIGSGFVVFKKKVLDDINLKSDGFDIHIEMLLKILRAGFKIQKMPLTYRHWHGGSFNVLKHGPVTVLRTLRLWYNMVILKR